ncbi:MAG: glutamate-1-semialdehyde 2,1-aminomutase [Gemmatimonadota bacterium]
MGNRNTGASRRLFAAAQGLIPGGVNSPVRAFGAVGGTPRFIREAHGARIIDEDGNSYVDYVGSWGVMLLGHDHPAVREAVARAIRYGTSFGAPTAAEVALAEKIVALVPSVDRVRLVNSGTEATMSAVRLARAVTGAATIVKFRGAYHGHADAFLVEAGSGAATLGVPSSPGVTTGAAGDTFVAEFNDIDSVKACFDRSEHGIACLIVEPVPGNMGCVLPAPGFLAALRGLCDEHGALLVFDEVMTGFRLAPGGAQERYGVLPDLTTLGKIVGGGLPVGAYGGRCELMDQVAPDGPVYQAGTLSGNPLATAAGLATLDVLSNDPDLYLRVERLTERLGTGLAAAAAATGLSACWNGVGSMGSLFFTQGPVIDWPTAAATDRERFGQFFHGMLDRGIYLAPSPFETWFVSAAHSVDDIDETLEAARSAMQESR